MRVKYVGGRVIVIEVPKYIMISTSGLLHFWRRRASTADSRVGTTITCGYLVSYLSSTYGR